MTNENTVRSFINRLLKRFNSKKVIIYSSYLNYQRQLNAMYPTTLNASTAYQLPQSAISLQSAGLSPLQIDIPSPQPSSPTFSTNFSQFLSGPRPHFLSQYPTSPAESVSSDSIQRSVLHVRTPYRASIIHVPLHEASVRSQSALPYARLVQSPSSTSRQSRSASPRDQNNRFVAEMRMKLKAARTRLNLTQHDVAILISAQYRRISQSAISRFETGSLRTSHLVSIAHDVRAWLNRIQ